VKKMSDLLMSAVWAVLGYFLSIIVNYIVVTFAFRKDVQFAQLGAFEVIHNLFNYALGFGLGYLALNLNMALLGIFIIIAILWIAISFVMVLKIIGLQKVHYVGSFLIVDTTCDYVTGFALSSIGGSVTLSTITLLSLNESLAWLSVPIWVPSLLIVFFASYAISYYRQKGDVEIYEE